MAFSTTSNEKFVKKGQLKIIITLADASGGGGSSAAMSLGDARYINFQVGGTFGVGGSVTVEASNDGVTFFALGTTVVFTAASIKSIAPASGDLGYLNYKLHLTAGDATTNLTFTVSARLLQAGTP